MVYQWKPGYGMGGDADRIGHEIETLGDAVSPRAVVELARDEATALHASFEWDDAKAAEEWRVEQARGIMRALVFVEERPGAPDDRVVFRAYESVEIAGDEDESTRAYMPIRSVLADKDLRAQIVARLRAVVAHAEDQMATYDYLVPVFRKARKHMAIVGGMLERDSRRKSRPTV